MFFRRPKPTTLDFTSRLEALREARFHTVRRPDGAYIATRDGCGAVIREAPGSGAVIERVGWMVDGEIAALVDGGFQKFWRTGNETRVPALAHQLKALHAFEEDLREALGLESRFNTSLGTTNDVHLYDRVARAHGPRRVF